MDSITLVSLLLRELDVLLILTNQNCGATGRRQHTTATDLADFFGGLSRRINEEEDSALLLFFCLTRAASV